MEQNSYHPIVDMTIMDHETEVLMEQRQKVGIQLVEALKTHGYAYIKTNFITKAFVDDLMSAAMRFFNLPPEVKLKYELKGKSFEGKNGYMGIDYERLDQSYTGAFELRESFNLYDLTVAFEADELCPGLQDLYYSFYKRGKDLILTILRSVAVGLKLENENIFEEMFEFCGKSGSLTLLRLLHYPPLSPGEDLDTLRCGDHSDYGIITLNFQDQVGGLEMLDRKTGNWVHVPYIEGTVLIQTGLAIEKMTDDLFTGTRHRVKKVGTNGTAKRQSITLFAQPDGDVILKNLFRFHLKEDGDENELTSRQYSRELYEATFKHN
ncbi:hypothetical protein CHUAL_003382 [Chamberlinius hualienensis]